MLRIISQALRMTGSTGHSPWILGLGFKVIREDNDCQRMLRVALRMAQADNFLDISTAQPWMSLKHSHSHSTQSNYSHSHSIQDCAVLILKGHGIHRVHIIKLCSKEEHPTTLPGALCERSPMVPASDF